MPSPASAASNAVDVIAGRAYEDANYNGIDDGEPGLPAVSVTVVNAAGSQFQSTSLSGGYYTITVNPASGPYRLEFSLPATLSTYSPSVAGVSRRNVGQRMLSGTSANENMGFYSSDNFCPAQPDVVVSEYTSGSANQTEPALVRFNPLAVTSTVQTDLGLQTMITSSVGAVNTVLPVNKVGAVWGAAYQSLYKHLFVTSLTKRHVGFGPLGPDGIYVVDPFINAVIGGFELDGLTPGNGGPAISIGAVNRTEVASPTLPVGDFQLSNDKAASSTDLDAFDKVGKVGYGGAAMSPDGSTLWTINLNQRALIAIDVRDANTPLTTSALAGRVAQYPLSSLPNFPVCANDDFRPWAVKIYGGKGYIGVVCSAQTSQSTTNLTAHVLSFDPAAPAAGVTSVLSFPLNYPREAALYNPAANGGSISGYWQRSRSWDRDRHEPFPGPCRHRYALPRLQQQGAQRAGLSG